MSDGVRKIISGMVYDEERSLYNLVGADVEDCTFAGPADGESVLKEVRDVNVRRCSFSLRYPLWHADTFRLEDSSLDELTRAPIWYARNGEISGSVVRGVKCLRECENITVRSSDIVSPEFGWKCRNLNLSESSFASEYFLFESENVTADKINMSGKYSFQYMNNVVITNSILNTKDAFWHSRNVTVRDSVLSGEYLAWFSDGLTLINCRISGTQPFCYCKNLKLIGCTMSGTDLSFEYSDVHADIIGEIMSVKNPRSGEITADRIGEIILEDSIMASDCKIRERGTDASV